MSYTGISYFSSHTRISYFTICIFIPVQLCSNLGGLPLYTAELKWPNSNADKPFVTDYSTASLVNTVLQRERFKLGSLALLAVQAGELAH